MGVEENGQTIAASSHAISRNWALFTKRCATRWKSKQNAQAQLSLSPIGDYDCRSCNALALAARPVLIARSAKASRDAVQHAPPDIASGEYHPGNDNGSTNAGRSAGAVRPEMERTRDEAADRSSIRMEDANQLLWPCSG